MAGSLKTTFFNLVKYAANDITSWLTDFNGNMDKIDAAMNQNKTAAQTAQDAVDNLEAEYKSLLTVVNGHTTSIDANEKAIAANTASIDELGNKVNGIVINDNIYFNLNSEEVTNIQEGTITSFGIAGCRVGNNFKGSARWVCNSNSFSNYHRQGNVPLIGKNAYITDLVRITGNPFNIPADKYFLLMTVRNSENSLDVSNDKVIAYISHANYTIFAFASANSEIYNPSAINELCAN